MIWAKQWECKSITEAAEAAFKFFANVCVVYNNNNSIRTLKSVGKNFGNFY